MVRAVLVVTDTGCGTHGAETISPKAAELLRSAIVWDNHGCMPLRADASFLPQLERYRKAGVTVASINIGFGEMSWEEHLKVLSFMRRWIAQRPGNYRLISTVEDVHRARADGQLGVVFDIEGMVPVQEHLSLVQTFHELGVRWMLIAYNRNNKAGGGCLDEDSGLTDIGRAIIDEMQRVGMVLCLSHAGARTVAEALEYARGPVIFSHSNPCADHPHPRNISDEVMRACAAKGGVIGLSGVGSFLGTHEAVVERLLRQLRYVIDLVGPEHVGLGLDYVFDVTELEELLRSNPKLFAPGTRSGVAREAVGPEATSAIAEGLVRDGLTDTQIRGILGENWLRIATRVWRS
jgi:membrane dipeptidase